MTSKESIGKLLTYYIIDKDISIKEIAEKLNVSRGSIYHWISGKPMTNRYYIKLLKMLEGYNPSAWVLDKSEAELKEYMFN